MGDADSVMMLCLQMEILRTGVGFINEASTFFSWILCVEVNGEGNRGEGLLVAEDFESGNEVAVLVGGGRTYPQSDCHIKVFLSRRNGETDGVITIPYRLGQILIVSVIEVVLTRKEEKGQK